MLGLPFPRWLTLAIGGTLAALVLMTYVLAALVGHADWADAARTAGIAAFALAGALIVGAVARLVLGRRGRQMLVGALGGALLLTALGSGGVVFSAPIHRLQANVSEGNSNWAVALREFRLAGETAPNAPDIARVYDEWSEQELRSGDYADSVEHLSIVLFTYSYSGETVRRAQSDLVRVYTAWLQTDDAALPFDAALQYLDTYRISPACDSACQTGLYATEAAGYYAWGNHLMAMQAYDQASIQFSTVELRFPQSTYVQQAHLAAAQAYYAWGTSALTSNNCSIAVSAFQTLVMSYRDTPEAAKASAALAQPVTVTGTLAGYPLQTQIYGYLSRSGHTPPYQAPAPAGSFSFSKDYSTRVDTVAGAFTFTRVRPGSYTFTTEYVTNGETWTTWWYNYDDVGLYFIDVGPLCPTNAGLFNMTPS